MKRVIITSLLLVSITILSISCSNFFQGSSLKNQIENEISYNSKKINKVYIAAEEGTGSVIPTGSHNMRIGDTITLEFTPSENAVFKYWQAVDKNTKKELSGVVEFSNSTALKCTATLLQDYSDILIRPFCLIKSESVPPVFNNLSVSRGDNASVLLSHKEYAETGDLKWEDEDYNTNHVNALNVYFAGVDKGSGIYSIKVTETLLKKFSGAETSGINVVEVKNGIINTGNEGEYSASFYYDFFSTIDGLIKLDFQLIDGSGNESDAKTYYVIKDTQMPDLFVCNNGVIDGKSTFIMYFPRTYTGIYYNPYERVLNESTKESPLLVEKVPGDPADLDTVDRWFGNRFSGFDELDYSYKFHNKLYAIPSTSFTKGHEIEFYDSSNKRQRKYEYIDCFVEVTGFDSSIDEPIEFYVKDKAGNQTTISFTIPSAEKIYNHEVDSEGKIKPFTNKEKNYRAVVNESGDEENVKLYYCSSYLSSFPNSSDYLIFDGNTNYELSLVPYISSTHPIIYEIYGDYSNKYIVSNNGLVKNEEIPIPDFEYYLISNGINSASYTLRVDFTNKEQLKNYDSIYLNSGTTTKISVLENNSFIEYKNLVPRLVERYDSDYKTVGTDFNITVISNGEKNTKSFNVSTATDGYVDNSAPQLQINCDQYGLTNTKLGQNLRAQVNLNYGTSSIFDENGECRLYYYFYPAKSEWNNYLLSYEIPDEVYENIDNQYVLSNEKEDYFNTYSHSSSYNPTFNIPIASLADGDYAVYAKIGDMAGNIALYPIGYFFKSKGEKPGLSFKKNQVCASGTTKYLRTSLTVKAEQSYIKYVTYNYFDSGSDQWENGECLKIEKSCIQQMDISFTHSYTTDQTEKDNWNNELPIGNKFLQIKTLNTNNNGDTEIGDYSNRIYRLSAPVYYYTGLGENTCKTKVLVKGIGGYVVYCDNPVYVHTLYASKDWGEDPDDWEYYVEENKKINPIQFDSSSPYTIDDSAIPAGSHYRVIAHFADGTSLMGEDMVKY